MSVSGRPGVIIKITRESRYAFFTIKDGSTTVKLHTPIEIGRRLKKGDAVLYSISNKKDWRYKGVNFGYIRKAN